MKPKFQWYMQGVGYGHPEWGHGHYKGENALGFDTFKTSDVNENAPGFQHVQAFSDVTLSGPAKCTIHKMCSGDVHCGS